MIVREYMPRVKVTASVVLMAESVLPAGPALSVFPLVVPGFAVAPWSSQVQRACSGSEKNWGLSRMPFQSYPVIFYGFPRRRSSL